MKLLKFNGDWILFTLYSSQFFRTWKQAVHTLNIHLKRERQILNQDYTFCPNCRKAVLYPKTTYCSKYCKNIEKERRREMRKK